MIYKVMVLTALVALTLARPDPGPVSGSSLDSTTALPANFYNVPSAYDYSVPAMGPVQNNLNNANNYRRGGASNGFIPQGSVTLPLPDGRVQRVAYSVNGTSGFMFSVTFEGVAQ
ncbi:uncharacterized protein LOC121877875 isoform X2 [Homarus americanus]|uniref:uncharacterized protein LOC121877875 isoform X2 n=1 Tax=Homarus americanus TaxID=6706 RepID=UPI001C47A4EC|nr:uncharacterized protein LOC121877875 isoform X2 [Homarus americanus]